MTKKSEPENKKKDVISDKERVDKGQVLVRVIIEVLGAPKEYVEEAIQLVIDRVHKIDKIEVVSENTYEAEEKDKLFATFSELEIWFPDIDILSKFLFEFTPSSIEIMQPTSLPLSANFVSGFMNDFLLKMHELGLKLKDTAATTQLLQKNADALVRNMFHMALKEPRSLKDISELTGIPEKNVQGIIDNFNKAGLIKKSGDKFVMMKK